MTDRKKFKDTLQQSVDEAFRCIELMDDDDIECYVNHINNIPPNQRARVIAAFTFMQINNELDEQESHEHRDR